MIAKTRIDQLLVARGLCASREKAQREIMAGRVTVGLDDRVRRAIPVARS